MPHVVFFFRILFHIWKSVTNPVGKIPRLQLLTMESTWHGFFFVLVFFVDVWGLS